MIVGMLMYCGGWRCYGMMVVWFFSRSLFFNVLASFCYAVTVYPSCQIPFGFVGSISLTQYLYNVLVKWVVNYWWSLDGWSWFILKYLFPYDSDVLILMFGSEKLLDRFLNGISKCSLAFLLILRVSLGFPGCKMFVCFVTIYHESSSQLVMVDLSLLNFVMACWHSIIIGGGASVCMSSWVYENVMVY